MSIGRALKCAGLFSLLLTPLNFVPRLEGQEKKEATADVSVIYTGTKTGLRLEGTKVAYWDREEEFANPVSGIPSKVVTNTRETVLKEAPKELLNAIKATGFYELKAEYGVPSTQKHYHYEIRIKDGATEKKVIYRSGGDETQRPEAFKKVETLLLDFGKRATTIKKP